MEEVLDQDLKNVDTKAPVVTKDKAIFTFEGTTEEKLDEELENFVQNVIESQVNIDLDQNEISLPKVF